MLLQRAGFWIGCGLFALILLSPPPEGLSIAAWRTAAVAALMAAWWFTEAVPVTLTGSLPFLLLPWLGVARPEAVASQYMNPVLFLVLGGAMMGLALEKWGLHRRIALAVIGRANTEPRLLLLAIMAVTAFVSMFVNNSATTVMMLPIATATLYAVTRTLDSSNPSVDEKRLAAAMVLSVAYAANIGGFATPIGTPVNPIAIGILERQFGIEITFLQWMAFGLPLAVLALPLCWWLLCRVAFRFELPRGRREDIVAAIGGNAPMSAPERRVLVVVGLTSAAWIFLPAIEDVFPAVTDASIAVASALVLCLLPSGDRSGPGGAARAATLLEWSDARTAPWYLILLLGGGLALADAVVKSGLSAWLGEVLGAVSMLPVLLLGVLIAAKCILVTECASNVATATTFMPIAATLALGGGHDPVVMALIAGVAASWGFANPAGTSSNAMVYGTGRIKVNEMFRAGLLFDVIGALLIAGVLLAIVPLLGLVPTR